MDPTTISATGSSAASTAAGSAAVGGLLGFLNYNTAKRMGEYNYQQQLRYLREGPSNQVAGYRAAGINPMLPYAKGNPSIGSVAPTQMGNQWGDALRSGSDHTSSAYGVQKTEEETIRTAAETERVIKDTRRLDLDNILTEGELRGLAKALAQPEKAGLMAGASAMSAKKATGVLAQIRADMAEADNFADLHELLNVPALQAGLDVIRAIPGLSGVADSISKIIERRKPRTRETSTQIIRDRSGRETGRDTFEINR